MGDWDGHAAAGGFRPRGLAIGVVLVSRKLKMSVEARKAAVSGRKRPRQGAENCRKGGPGASRNIDLAGSHAGSSDLGWYSDGWYRAGTTSTLFRGVAAADCRLLQQYSNQLLRSQHCRGTCKTAAMKVLCCLLAAVLLASQCAPAAAAGEALHLGLTAVAWPQPLNPAALLKAASSAATRARWLSSCPVLFLSPLHL